MCKFKIKIIEIFDILNCLDWNMSLFRNYIFFIDLIDFLLFFFLEGGCIWYMYYFLIKLRDNFYLFYYFYFFLENFIIWLFLYIYFVFIYLKFKEKEIYKVEL